MAANALVCSLAAGLKFRLLSLNAGVIEVELGTLGVSSFNGRTGAVVPQLGDYAASLVINDSNVLGATVGDALAGLVTNRPDLFGGGQDGDLTASSGTTTLTRPTFYRTVTLSGTAKVNMNGFPLFIQHFDATNAPAGAIEWTPNNGGNGVAGSSAGNEGGAALAATNYLGGGGAGGGGGDPATNAGNPGIAGSKPAGVVTYGGAGGTGGTGGNGAGGAGGAGAVGGTVDAADAPGMLSHLMFAAKAGAAFNFVLFGGGAGGGGGGGGAGSGAGNQGGTGAGAGSGGGSCYLAIGKITTGPSTPAGVVRVKGGNGGNGSNTASPGVNTGGGAGGAGGAGGFAYCILGSVVGQNVVGFFDASGGNGGTGGAGDAGGTAGASGAGGGPGRIQLMHVAKNTTTINTGAAAIGTAGGVCVTSALV